MGYYMRHDPTINLTAPYGGELVQLLVDPARAAQIAADSVDWPSWGLSHRQACDLELLLCGAFSPLRSFLDRQQYDAVCQTMRLPDGTLWPLPVVLDIDQRLARRLSPGDPLCLRDAEGVLLALLHVEQTWQPDLEREARLTLGTTDTRHPGARQLLQHARPWYVAGRLEGLRPPLHHDFALLRRTPAETRRDFGRRGWRRVMAFQTRNPIHRIHRALTLKAAREHQANLLLHPVVGSTKPGDVDPFTRIRCYQAVLPHFPQHNTMLSLLNMSMRMAGPREALLQAIIRRNHGCSHFIVGRDQAGPGGGFYEPRAAQQLALQHEDELGIRIVPVGEMVYLEQQDRFCVADEAPADARVVRVTGTDTRRRLVAGKPPPAWYSFPEVLRHLRRTYPARHRQGLTVFFTGLSGAGESTLANVLMVKLLELGGRPVTLLDGDIVRRHLSSELTFSREHRDINIRRIGYVASEITKNKGIAICAPIAPYDRVRQEVRQMIAPLGGFVLVHVATPLPVCEARDRKGMYAKARAGVVKNFTGISDPYEEPTDAELSMDTSHLSPAECVQQVLLFLEQQGYVGHQEP